MPIVGLETSPSRLRRIGHIRLGDKTLSERTGFEHPRALDHFTLDPVDPDFLPELNGLYGEQPRRLPVVFPSDDLEVTFSCYYRLYRSQERLICKGTGEKAVRATEDSPFLDEKVECVGPAECEFSLAHGPKPKPGKEQKPGCRRTAFIQVILPNCPRFGVWQINTGSRNGILNLLSAFKQLRGATGRIAFLPPVWLVIEPRQFLNPETGKPQNNYIMDVEIPMSLVQLQEAAHATRAIGASVPLPSEALPEDLYPRSQFKGLPGPDTGKVTVDADTGEVLEDRGKQTDPPPQEPTLEIDRNPDVAQALDAAAFPPAKQAALLASAREGKWSVEQFLAIIKQQGGGAGAGARTPPAPTTPAAPVARQTKAQPGQKVLF